MKNISEENEVKWILFSITFCLLYWRVCIDNSLMQTRHFTRTLCKQKVKAFFLKVLKSALLKVFQHL